METSEGGEGAKPWVYWGKHIPGRRGREDHEARSAQEAGRTGAGDTRGHSEKGVGIRQREVRAAIWPLVKKGVWKPE